jgi:hypothetical protein
MNEGSHLQKYNINLIKILTSYETHKLIKKLRDLESKYDIIIQQQEVDEAKRVAE